MAIRIFYYPKWLKGLYPESIWGFSLPKKSPKTIYITFDDGPSSEATKWILETLKSYQVKATFFCIGNNVVKQPDLYNKIIQDGHKVGNHTMNHLNGFKTENETYINDVESAKEHIDSNLFRPPYGKLKRNQAKRLKGNGFKIVFWSILTYDFDSEIPVEKAIQKIKSKVRTGQILVFHDSKKAFEQVILMLPEILEFLKEEGYTFKTISRT